jgi:hypothetical protein
MERQRVVAKIGQESVRLVFHGQNEIFALSSKMVVEAISDSQAISLHEVGSLN